MGSHVELFKFVAFDFDDTVCTDNYPGTGIIEPRHERIIEFLRKCKANGSIMLLNTCREGKELNDAVQFCNDNNVPIDYVNENPLQDFPSRKLYASIYVDDRSISAYDLEGDIWVYTKNKSNNK